MHFGKGRAYFEWPLRKRDRAGKIGYQTEILVQLIDRIRVLQTDILKLDTMVRTKYGLDVDENRI